MEILMNRFVLVMFIIISLSFTPCRAQAVDNLNYIPIVQGDLYGLITITGDMAIEPQFDYAQNFSEKLAAVQTTNGKWGYIDSTGTFIIEPEYDHASRFSQGLGFVGKNGKFGFVNKSGEMVIEPQVDGGGSFNNELANVLVENKWGYIGTGGQFVIEPKFDGAEDFHEGLARICIAPEGGDCFRSDGKKFGFIDKDGEIVIPAKFDYAEHFSGGLAMAQTEKNFGFIDKTGKWVIQPVYSNAGAAFSEGLARVTTKNGENFFIDSDGEVVLKQPNGFLLGQQVSNGLIMSMDQNSGNWGFMNKEGTVIIPADYDRVLPFKHGIAPAMSNSKWGCINTNGEWIIDPIFDHIGSID